MNYKTIVEIAPTVEPVTLVEAKNQLRIEPSFTVDDDLINALISASRDRVEQFLNRYVTEQTLTMVFYDDFPVGLNPFYIPLPDVKSIASIFYQDSAGTETEITDFSYDSQTQWLRATNGWPSGMVTLKVSLVTSAPVEMSGVKQGLLMMLTDLYELRAESVVNTSITNNPAVMSCLGPYRVEMGI